MELDENIRKKLTSEEINELPLVHYGGPVSIIRSKMLLDLALPALKEEPVLGFDTESRPTFRKGVAHYPSLIQLATAKCVYIIQLKHLPLNREITDLLSSPNQIKAGVGIGEDMRKKTTSAAAGSARLQPVSSANASPRGPSVPTGAFPT